VKDSASSVSLIMQNDKICLLQSIHSSTDVSRSMVSCQYRVAISNKPSELLVVSLSRLHQIGLYIILDVAMNGANKVTLLTIAICEKQIAIGTRKRLKPKQARYVRPLSAFGLKSHAYFH
jgi:hypothetical protein